MSSESKDVEGRDKASSTSSSYLLISASSGVAVVATFLSGVLLARLLSVEERGVVALIVYWCGFAAVFGSFSLGDALIYRSRDETHSLDDKLPSALLLTMSVAAIIIGLAAISLVTLSDKLEGVPLSFAVAIVAAFVAINHLNAVLMAVERANLRFARLALEQAILPLLYSGLIAIAAFTIYLSVEIVLIVFIVSRLPIFALRIWRYRMSFVGKVKLNEIRGLGETGMRFHAVAIVKALSEQADKIIVSIQWTVANVSYFAVGYSAVGAAYGLISHALGTISLPVMSKLSPQEVAPRFAESLRITLLVIVAALTPVLLLAPFLIPFVFGSQYAEAVIVTQVLGLALLPSPLIGQTDAVLRARGQVRAALRMHCIAIAIIAIGWVVTGYPDIVSLGVMLAAARVIALVVTIVLAGGELAELRLRDCLIWRKSDFAAIWGAARDFLMKVKRVS